MLSKNILIYYALFLTVHCFPLTGCDRDPETGEKIETSESSGSTVDKYYFTNYYQIVFY